MSILNFINDIKALPLMIHQSGYEALTVWANSIYNGAFPPEKKTLAVYSTSGQSYSSGSAKNPFDSWEKGSIAVIPLQGIMLKSGSWWYYGVDEISDLLRLAYDSDRISAVLIKGNTPGGSTDSVYVMEETLRNRNKPTWMLVDGMLCSCGIYIGSFCDKIYAINEMCNIGSLGVFARMVAPVPGENSGYKIVEVYPDESSQKNYPEREAIKGNEAPLKEELSRLAIHFQNVVKQNRPNITDQNVFAGKTFYAGDAAAVGLIDAVKSERDTITELLALTNVSQEIQTEISSMYK